MPRQTLDSRSPRHVHDQNARGEAIPFVITVDVEPDDAWSDHRNRSLANICELRRLQTLLDGFGAKATLLCTHTVVQNDDAWAVVRELADGSGAEIGSHLHPWENPPYLESGLDVKFPTFPHELPGSSFRDKMECLTQAIMKRADAPTSYRAGRWGLAAEHLPVLEELGYTVDTSVIPLINWGTTFGIPAADGGRGGPDYRFAPQEPYHPDYANPTVPGGAAITELPVTVAFTRAVPRFVRRNYGRLPVLAHRVLRKSEMLRPVWCNPAEQPADRLRRMMRVAISRPVAHINMAFHSSELMLGGSPSTRTEEAVEGVFRRIELLLTLAAESGRCRFDSLSSAARRLSRRGAAVTTL
jgi:peptidoglycan/xylan/chitin deacetylase (PgdA/CDA1 family)